MNDSEMIFSIVIWLIIIASLIYLLIRKIIKEENDNNSFVIPQGTQIIGNGFLVIVKDTNDFSTFYPNIPHIGELGFGLGRSDAIRLFNSESKLMDEVHYNIEDVSPSCNHILNMYDSYGEVPGPHPGVTHSCRVLQYGNAAWSQPTELPTVAIAAVCGSVRLG